MGQDIHRIKSGNETPFSVATIKMPNLTGTDLVEHVSSTKNIDFNTVTGKYNSTFPYQSIIQTLVDLSGA